MALPDRLLNLYHDPLRLGLRVPPFRHPFLGPQARPVPPQVPRLHLHGRFLVRLPALRRVHRGLNQITRRVLPLLPRLSLKAPDHPRNRNRPIDLKRAGHDETYFYFAF